MRNAILAGMVLSVGGALLACGGGGSSGGGGGGDCENVAGAWRVTETVQSSTCADTSPGDTTTYDFTISQSGCSLSVQVSGSSAAFHGSLSGSKLTWSGSFPEDGGTTTTHVQVTSSGGSAWTGSSTWSWAGDGSCSGTSAISAVPEG